MHRFEHPWQAELFQGLLNQEGIQNFTIEGAREYTTILTGIGQPVTQLFVDESDMEKAQKFLESYLRQSHLHLVEDLPEQAPKKPENPFRKVLFFSLAGAVVLPVMLNIFAVYHLIRFLKLEDETLFRKFVAVSVVIAGWSGTIALLYIAMSHFFEF